MRRTIWSIGSLALVSFLTVALVGCGGSDSGGAACPTGTAPCSPGAASPGTTASSEGPAATVFTFLEGFRTGNDETANAMLTSVARRELAKAKLSVSPPCDDTARFVVGEVRPAGSDIAHVASRWTYTNPKTGQPQTSDMTWVLRRENGQWRIGGMAMTVFEGEAPLLLNYEDPADMLEQKRLLKAEIARRAQKAAAAPGVAETPQTAPVKR